MTHPFGDDVELRRRILGYLGDQALPRIVRLTAPLFVPGASGDAELVASGLILQVGTARFLLTATHVVNDRPGLGVNVGDEFVQIRGARATICTEGVEPGSTRDRMDVSLIRLESALADRIATAHVLTLADLDLTIPKIGRDPFLMSGYPERRNRDGLEGDTFTARAYSLLMHDGELELYRALGLDEALQLALPFERKDVWEIERQVTAPNFEGISGGGLWRVPIHDDAPVRDTRLAAIAVEQHPKGPHRHVLATRIRTVLQTIHRFHTDLREQLESEYGAAVV